MSSNILFSADFLVSVLVSASLLDAPDQYSLTIFCAATNLALASFKLACAVARALSALANVRSVYIGLGPAKSAFMVAISF